MTSDISRVAEHYAQAILELATAGGADKAVLDNLRLVSEALNSNPEFDVVLAHPGVTPAEKKQLIISVFGGRVHELTLRLLELLADRRRLEVLAHIEKEYERLWRQKQNIVTGTLYYAEKPDARVLADVKAKLQKQLGKTIELDETEDKSLIGGYLLRIGDRVIDGSLKGRLQAIEKQLLSV